MRGVIACWLGKVAGGGSMYEGFFPTTCASAAPSDAPASHRPATAALPNPIRSCPLVPKSTILTEMLLPSAHENPGNCDRSGDAGRMRPHGGAGAAAAARRVLRGHGARRD